MAAAQQVQEQQANKSRQPAPAYKVGDKVWLKLTNVKTRRPNRKLDDKAAKYTVTKVVTPHSYRLDVPGDIHNVFHVDLLRPASTDPLPSQVRSDYQPPPILEDREALYLVDAIIKDRKKRLRGRNRYEKQFLVKWTGYQRPTWEPEENIRLTDAYKVYMQSKGGGYCDGLTPYRK